MRNLKVLNCDEITGVAGGKINLNIYNVSDINSPIISIEVSEQDIQRTNFFNYLIPEAGTVSKKLLFCSDYFSREHYNNRAQQPNHLLVYCVRGQG